MLKKYEDGEVVTTSDTGEHVTINGYSYSEKRNSYIYSVKENPGFFYLENDFERVSSIEATEVHLV